MSRSQQAGGAAQWLMSRVDTATAGLVNEAMWDCCQAAAAAALTDTGYHAKCSRPTTPYFGLTSVYMRKNNMFKWSTSGASLVGENYSSVQLVNLH